MAKGTQGGTKGIRAVFLAARRQIDEAAAIVDPDPNALRDGVRPGQWEGAPHDTLPPGCPVSVVGRDVNGLVHVITATNDLRAVARWDHPSLIDIFAPYPNFAYWAWPAMGKATVPDGEGGTREELRVKRLEVQKAAACLINAASKRPLFDPGQQHRGRGGWQDRTGRFLWHSGGWLWSGDAKGLDRARPNEHEGFLYTRQPGTIEPWDMPIADGESPAHRILADLRTWKWERPYLDPLLCLGWIGCALYGGALKTRPIVFLTGGQGVGKSTLMELFKTVLEGAAISFADTTAAGIYQRVKQDALPAMVDELEAKAGSTKAQSVIDLARLAYTGSEMGRGGADHEAVSFRLQLAFLFAAIQPPPMTEADMSRMAVLHLSPHQAGAQMKINVKPEVDGRMLLRQLMDGWRDFQDRLMPSWWDVLHDQGLDSRAIDTYGPLLAAAELMVGPAALEEVGLPVTEHRRLGEIIAHATALERAERLDNWHACLNRLLDSPIDAWRDGVKPTVGATCEAIGSGKTYPHGLTIDEARDRLKLVNLGVQPGEHGRGYVLAVPKDGPALEKLFEGTRWERGGWWGALKQGVSSGVVRLPGNDKRVKINGSAKYCLLVDMAGFAAHVERLDAPAGDGDGE